MAKTKSKAKKKSKAVKQSEKGMQGHTAAAHRATRKRQNALARNNKKEFYAAQDEYLKHLDTAEKYRTRRQTLLDAEKKKKNKSDWKSLL